LRPNTKPSSATVLERLIRVHFTHLESRKLTSIEARDITAVLSAMADRPIAANHALAALKLLFNWAASQQHIERNPIADLKKPYKKRARERLLTPTEIRAIWLESFNHDSFGQLIRCLILSGQRLNQFAAFDPQWVQAHAIIFPPSIMKSNAEMTLPLTDTLRRELPSGPLLPSISTATAKFRRSLTIPHFTLHDFRRFFSSTMASLQVPLDITEMLLSHVTGSRTPIQRIYDRFDRLAPMREALLKYEEYLARLLQSDGT
jgi:integrase